MNATAPAAVKRFWLILWSLAVGLALLLLFSTLSQRTFAPESLQHFPLQMLTQGRQFSREVRTVGTAQFLASMAVMLWLCFSEPGARLLTRLEGIGGGRRWVGLASVAAGVTVLLAAVELPFSYYIGHAHELSYGLTHQSAGGWLMDYLTSTGLHLLLSLFLWLPIYWLIHRSPRRWWLPATLFSAGYTGLLIFLGPLLIMPMFSQVTPVRDQRVLAMVERLADRAGVKVERVQELIVSDKTSRVNAMVTGLGASKQILVYDTLLRQFPQAEVEVVLAHELAHAVHRDVVTNWILSGFTDVLLLGGAAWMLLRMQGVWPLHLPVSHAPRGLALLMLLSTLFSNVTAPVQNYISRRMEVRADRFALMVTGNPDAFISGFRKLAGGNPGDVDPPPVVEFLDHSHPSIMNRIRAAEDVGSWLLNSDGHHLP